MFPAICVIFVPVASVTFKGVGPAIPTEIGLAGNVICNGVAVMPTDKGLAGSVSPNGVGVVTATLWTTATPWGLATFPTVTFNGVAEWLARHRLCSPVLIE